MITTTKQIEQAAQEEERDWYLEGLQDGLQASRITDSDAFFEIGLAVLCLAIGGLMGWAVALS